MSALELAQSLIKIKSISPEDGGCFDLIEAELTPMGFQIEKIPELNCETLLAKVFSLFENQEELTQPLSSQNNLRLLGK